MKKIFLLIFILSFFSSVTAQYNWDQLSYNHTTVSNSDNSKIYYTITLYSNGNGKLEYFKDGKVNSADFRISRSKVNFINSKLKKSGIFKVNPNDLAADSPQSYDYMYTMTLSLERVFGKKYEYKFDRSKLPPKPDKGKKEEKEEEEEGEKSQVIPIPNNLKQEYKKQFYDLYYDIESIVPNKTWKEVDADLN